jgi:hypothetical protein
LSLGYLKLLINGRTSTQEKIVSFVVNNCNSTGEREYYEKQFATLQSFEEVDSMTFGNEIDEEKDLTEQKQSEFAMRISNYANIVLLALKVCTNFLCLPY